MPLKRTAGILCSAMMLVSFSFVAYGSGETVHADAQSPSPLAVAQETLVKLMEGNARFSTDQLIQSKSCTALRRTELTQGQHPKAVVLSCSDSRVPPEYIFDQGLGDVFIVRVAGNVADAVELGSIEYAVEHLHVPLVIVMGHDKCGAVAATVKGGKPEGNVRAIVTRISPAVRRAATSGKKGEELLDAAIIENVNMVKAGLIRESKLLKHAVAKKELLIVGAKYNMTTGKVELIGKQ